MTDLSVQGRGPASTFARLDPTFVSNPYAVYEELRAVDPVLWAPDLFGMGGWLVTGHAACSSVLRSKHFGREGHKILPAEKLAHLPQEAAGRQRETMVFRDPPDHTRLRGLVSQAFTPRTVEQLRPHIAEIAEQLLDAVDDAGRADLIRDFAFPLPITVIAELLGVPPEDRHQFKAWSTVITRSFSPVVTRDELLQIEGALDAIEDYLGRIVEERRRKPRADLLSELVRARDADDRLSTGEILATCRGLLIAGHETTANLIGNGVLALLQNPAQKDALAEDPTLLPGAVEELLRYDCPVQMTMRFAFAESPIGSHTARRGDLVVLLLGAANRDPTQYEEPARLDIRRADAHTHLSFGGGIHYCMGASLARAEGQIAIGALLRRLPRLALGSEPQRWRPDPVFRGLSALPVTF